MGGLAGRVTVALAAVLVGGGAVLGLGPAAVVPEAGAATCTAGGGVSVVVDYRELGGGVTTACATDGGGRSATAIVDSVGVSLTYAQRQPGFVCRVNGVPTSDPCQNASPADAYWGLWWSDGTSGSWVYSSYSSGSLTVPAGGSVGWAWKQGSGSAAPPGVAPPVFAASPSPSTSSAPTSSPSSSPTSPPATSPTSSPSSSPTGNGGSNSGSASGSQSSSPSPSPTTSSPAATQSESAAPGPSESPVPSESPSDSRTKKGAEAPSEKGGSEEGASASADPEVPELGAESPGDSTSSGLADASAPTADQPARVPAAVTWGVVALIAVAIAVSGVVARRRRGV